MAPVLLQILFDRLRKETQDKAPSPDVDPFEPLEDKERDGVRAMVLEAAKIIPRSWPLGTFVYRNALQGFEHLTFKEAVREGGAWFGGRGYLPEDSYRAYYRDGKITDEALTEALHRSGWFSGIDDAVRFGNRTVNAVEIVRTHFVYGIEAIDEHAFFWRMTQEQSLRRYRPDVPVHLRVEPEAVRVALLWEGALEAMGLGGFNTVPSAVRPDEASHGGPWDTRKWGLLSESLTRIGKHGTLLEWIETAADDPLVGLLDEQLIKWCSGFLDEGMTEWPMPSRHLGFYGTWRDLAPHDCSFRALGIRDAPRRIRSLPRFPEETLAGCLTRLGIPRERWGDYLARHLAMLPGWTGFIKWRAGESDYSWQRRHPVDLVDYLAVRLYYELELAENACRRLWDISAHLRKLERYAKLRSEGEESAGLARSEAGGGDREAVFRDGWRLFHLAQLLGVEPGELRRVSEADQRVIFHLLDAVSEKDPGPVWLTALEGSYRKRLLARLAFPKHDPPGGPDTRPRAQAVFCIDARSEGLRRHLEELGGYVTYGFAGFFGVPICFRPYGSEEEQFLCPALIRPSRVVVERPGNGREKEAARREKRRSWHHLLHGLFHDLKANNFTAYPLIDFLGGFFGLSFLAKTVFPRFYRRLQDRMDRAWHPPVSTRLEFERPDAPDPSQDRFGFTRSEQAEFVENGLRMMGLTKNFARVVLFCAHGSTSENNPYAAAYDCGACGGNHGGPNARTLAAMANNLDIRRTVAESRITIPGDTLFLAGEHDTTTDRVVLLDEETVPDSHREEALRLFGDLNRAGTLSARERVARLPDAPRSTSPEEASRHAEERSVDWSQVRPEWGLSSNAAFFVGRRDHTEGVDLEGRVFLHSYDAAIDHNGRALETIMTAPLLVVQWISMEYYFSSVDFHVYGAGSKFLHNVVGGVGVMLGRSSDLRPGLPMQSVMNGDAPYHEPVRPLVIIESPEERVEAVIAKHDVLKQLFDNQWVLLLVMNPEDHSISEYRPGGGWSPVRGNAGHS